MELDPLNITVNRGLAQWLGATGQDEAALAQWNRALELEPDQCVRAPDRAAPLRARANREGSMYLDRARSLAGDDPLTVAQLAVAARRAATRTRHATCSGG